MGGFSSNYEGGYLDFDDDPKWMNQNNKKENRFAYLKKKKVYTVRNGTHYNYLNVRLTTANLLTSKEQEKREELCKIDDSDILLSLKYHHEEFQVYYEESYIGSVQKVFEEDNIDNNTTLNTFCFSNNELKDIEAFWDGENFFLREKKHHNEQQKRF